MAEGYFREALGLFDGEGGPRYSEAEKGRQVRLAVWDNRRKRGQTYEAEGLIREAWISSCKSETQRQGNSGQPRAISMSRGELDEAERLQRVLLIDGRSEPLGVGNSLGNLRIIANNRGDLGVAKEQFESLAIMREVETER